MPFHHFCYSQRTRLAKGDFEECTSYNIVIVNAVGNCKIDIGAPESDELSTKLRARVQLTYDHFPDGCE